MANRTVIIAGATGLVGRELLRGLLADPFVDHVHVVGRRAPPVVAPKLTAHIVDFAALTPLPSADELYLALGTTIKVAGSQAAFRAVDHDANLAVAKAALAGGTRRVGLVSAMGADAKSRIFYSRVKGELEEDLGALPFAGLVIARPSLLMGPREELGQPARPGEAWGNALNTIVGFLIPPNYKPIPASDVAQALLSTVPTAAGVKVLLSGEMRR
ncbi:nucleoside-diphosphate sugar epimerase [Bradyrhizobium sp. SRS-191]|uniref:nucleoside-diphosphate sugar epimerase n=1 Tax=Bradyrhizobium sp. SRS-191 TaxID=2962606 RepID=UPI00211EE847|nr:nucleoside-diphosphate sugar epimerase [Bradyrhizobium sp. SRS-191]